jgi:hypothetical protein
MLAASFHLGASGHSSGASGELPVMVMGHYDIVLSHANQFSATQAWLAGMRVLDRDWTLEPDVTALMITTKLCGMACSRNLGSTKGQNRLAGKDWIWIYLGLRDTMELCALTFTGSLALRLVFNAG